MRAQQRLPAQLRREGVLHHLHGPAGRDHGALVQNVQLRRQDGDQRPDVLRLLVVQRWLPLLRAGRRDRAVGPDHVDVGHLEHGAGLEALPSPRKGSARGLAGERKGSGTPRKGSAREVQGTAGLLRQYSEQI